MNILAPDPKPCKHFYSDSSPPTPQSSRDVLTYYHVKIIHILYHRITNIYKKQKLFFLFFIQNNKWWPAGNKFSWTKIEAIKSNISELRNICRGQDARWFHFNCQYQHMVRWRQEQNPIMNFAVPFVKMLTLCMLWRARLLSDFYAFIRSWSC